MEVARSSATVSVYDEHNPHTKHFCIKHTLLYFEKYNDSSKKKLSPNKVPSKVSALLNTYVYVFNFTRKLNYNSNLLKIRY